MSVRRSLAPSCRPPRISPEKLSGCRRFFCPAVIHPLSGLLSTSLSVTVSRVCQRASATEVRDLLIFTSPLVATVGDCVAGTSEGHARLLRAVLSLKIGDLTNGQGRALPLIFGFTPRQSHRLPPNAGGICSGCRLR